MPSWRCSDIAKIPFLPWGNEVQALEPHGQGQLGGIEEGAGGHGGLAVAAVALLELAGIALTGPVVATVRAHESWGPAPLVQGIEALPFGAVEGEERVEADAPLELNRLAGHEILLLYQ